MKKIKVIHVFTDTGGNPQGISRSLNEIGISSEVWVMNESQISYGNCKSISKIEDSLIIKEIKKLFALRYTFMCELAFFNFGAGLYKPYIPIPKNIKLIRKVLYFFYSLYSKLMANIEVRILKLNSIPIFIQYQGDDIRQGDFCRKTFKFHFVNQVGDDYYWEKSDEAKRKTIMFYDKFVSKTYVLNPDLIPLCSNRAEFLPYCHIFLSDWKPPKQNLEGKIRIGHAPTNRKVKGTDLIIKSLNILKKEGFDFEFILIENKKNNDARVIYETLDIFIDQLFAGWYGCVAVELMALGKPVICYIRETDLNSCSYLMNSSELPFIHANPDNIIEVLRSVLSLSKKDLSKIGINSRIYVEKWHNPLKIVRRLESDMQKVNMAFK